MKRKPTQPRLLSPLEPIGDSDALSIDDLTTRYRCRCGNIAETGVRLEAVTCTKCGAAMKPVTT